VRVLVKREREERKKRGTKRTVRMVGRFWVMIYLGQVIDCFFFYFHFFFIEITTFPLAGSGGFRRSYSTAPSTDSAVG